MFQEKEELLGSLIDGYQLPHDIARMITHARQRVAHAIRTLQEPEKYIAKFFYELRDAPLLVDHYSEDDLFHQKDKNAKKLEPSDIRNLYLLAVIAHAKLYAWHDFLNKNDYSDDDLKSRMTRFKEGIGQEKFRSYFNYVCFESTLNTCRSGPSDDSPDLVYVLKMATERAIRARIEMEKNLPDADKSPEDICATHKALEAMTRFEDNWWVVRPVSAANQLSLTLER